MGDAPAPKARTSRAAVARTFGDPAAFRLESLQLPPPGPSEIRIAVRAIGVSYFDVLVAAGRYQVRPSLPFVPGSECAGVVEAVGVEVAHLKPGERVMATWFGGGVLADAALFPAEAVWAIPDDMPFVDAAVFPISYATAYHALRQRADLQAGESLLVLGAGGATGYAAVQVGKLFGATVIASASTPGKRALAAQGGADHLIDSTSSQWRDDLRAVAGKRGVDVVFDPVGGAATEPAFRSLAWKGRHLVVGFAGGEIPRLAANLALLKGAALVGVDYRQFGLFEPQLARGNLETLLELRAGGALAPSIARTYPLERFAEAMRDVTDGQGGGRIVIVVD